MSAVPPRDQARSVFTDILEDLLARVLGVEGIALVDRDGEAVDYAGRLEPFAIKVAGAHLQLVLTELAEAQLAEAQPPTQELATRADAYRKPALAALGGFQSVAIRTEQRSFAAHCLSDGYSLVLVMSHRCLLVSQRAIGRALRMLAQEAGWDDALAEPELWRGIEVQTTASDLHRPAQVKLGSRWEGVEVLGSVVGLRHEHGYRIRTSSGAELTIVREQSGHWYAENDVDPARE